jgi:hypothetical protein
MSFLNTKITLLDGKMIVKDVMKKFATYVRVYSSTHLEKVRKTMKKLNQESQSPVQESNPDLQTEATVIQYTVTPGVQWFCIEVQLKDTPYTVPGT